MSVNPRVSILIPNYNNGSCTTADGRDINHMRSLLESLEATLAAEATPFEIIACDDGSTDDSIDTLRGWADRTGPDGQPFLKLIEQPHDGCLARTSNKLVREARGDILVRLDGDIDCLTPNWVSRLATLFDRMPERVGVIGPKQLRRDGRIHAFGDWVLHPLGYHHVGTGLPRDAIRWPIEVDHVMGCFYCFKRPVWASVGGFDENLLRGQTVDFGLMARHAGWRAVAVPHIEFTHKHDERPARPTRADTTRGISESRSAFFDKWGFDRIQPDLDAVRDRYRGTPLLWNMRWFGIDEAFAQEPAGAVTIEQTQWHRYGEDKVFQARTGFHVQVGVQIAGQLEVDGPIVVVGCGAGLLPHLLAKQGLTVVGIDRRASHVELAQQCVKNQGYPAARPSFIHQPDPRTLPLDGATVGMVLMCDVIEQHANPVGLLAQCNRVLQPGGLLAVTTPRKQGIEEDVTRPEHRYFFHELINQVQHSAGGNWDLPSGANKQDPKRDHVVIARRKLEAAAPAKQQPAQRPAKAQAQSDPFALGAA